MTFRIDRRSFMMTGTLGLGAFAVPGFVQSVNVASGGGFTHSVASGEPGPHSVLLWTRYMPNRRDSARLRVELSESPDFARIAGGGEMTTGAWRDWTAKITVGGLKPGTRYHYRFVDPDGLFSPTGRTNTLPVGPVARFGIAAFSCSNLPFGFFNAYGHAAMRDDIDLAVHLGDYFYEYRQGGYAPSGGAVDGRWPLPEGETIHLADYRLRYASYRADPQLQALHAAKPMIVQWDDHETANDSWQGGAQNHSPDEGDWSTRKAAGIQVFNEWMPVSENYWGSYDIGTLATLFRTESRLLNRTRPPEIENLLQSRDPAAALRAFRDGSWQDSAATMLGTEQEAWLADAMRASVKAGKRWQVVGFGTIMGQLTMPKDTLSLLRPETPDGTRRRIEGGLAAAGVGLPFNYDNWGGYPAARARFLKSAQAAGANLIVICGDSHNGWAFDLGQDGKPAGVEFAGHSVSSPGYETSLAADPAAVARALVSANPELKWCDTRHRGYMALTLAPDRVRNDWVFVDTVLQRSTRASIGHSATVLRGPNRMS